MRQVFNLVRNRKRPDVVEKADRAFNEAAVINRKKNAEMCVGMSKCIALNWHTCDNGCVMKTNQHARA